MRVPLLLACTAPAGSSPGYVDDDAADVGTGTSWSEPFRELTLAIWDCCPDSPPYGGRHSDIVPHLCVAQIADGPQLDAVAEELEKASIGKLPIQATANEVALMDNSSGRWQVRTTLRL